MSEAEQIARDAHIASTILKTLSNEQRTDALRAVHAALSEAKDEILAANRLDMQAAESGNLGSALIKRLDLSAGDKYDSMLKGVLDVAALEDPLGKITLATRIDDGLDLFRVTCPVGVLLVIFESRPEVIANITALAVKSGNAAILKGGKESLHTFQAMAAVVARALAATAVPRHAVQLVATREEVGALLAQDRFIDLVIPRGSNALVRNIKANTKIPVLGHADGICSVFLDAEADVDMAKRIVVDAKTNYPAGCNAVEQLLVHADAVARVLPSVAQALVEAGVTLHVTPEVQAVLEQSLTEEQLKHVVPAESDAFDKEWLSLDVSVATVASVADAVAHINQHSSKHTDCIITENKENAAQFLRGVDSAGVYWNASTRFADGFRYGFGTEVGISTNKIHARGPVGLEGLVCYQYLMKGSGQIAGDYEGAGGSRAFKHEQLDVKNVSLDL